MAICRRSFNQAETSQSFAFPGPTLLDFCDWLSLETWIFARNRSPASSGSYKMMQIVPSDKPAFLGSHLLHVVRLRVQKMHRLPSFVIRARSFFGLAGAVNGIIGENLAGIGLQMSGDFAQENAAEFTQFLLADAADAGKFLRRSPDKTAPSAATTRRRK